MKLIVTGGTGFIGKWFLKQYARQYDCIVLGIEPDISELVFEDIRVPFIRANFSYGELVERLESADAALHLAARRYQTGDAMNDYLENISISSNLFQACKERGIRNVVHISSIGAYGASRNIPWVEEGVASPATFYAIAKLAVEHVSAIYNLKNDMRIKNLRAAQVIGPDERQGFMLSEFLEKARKGETIGIFGRGEGRREYVYVKDVAKAIHHALSHPEEKGIFNVGMGKNVSHFELAEAINRVFDNTGNIEFLSDKSEDKTIHQMDIRKAKNRLGWEPEWSLEEALMDIKKIVGGYSNIR